MNAAEAPVYRPRSLDELDSTVAGASETRTFVAGATDLLVNPDRWHGCSRLVDLTTVRELTTTVRWDEGGLHVGAAMPLAEIIRHPLVTSNFPLLSEACRQIGSAQIQNRATLGGNIANASPAGDSLPVLNVYDAQLLLGPRSSGTFERIAVSEIMHGPGQTALAGRYVAFVTLPKLAAGYFRYFRKVGQRYSSAISKLSLAVLIRRDDERVRDIRICAGSVSATVRRATRTETLLLGKVLDEDLIALASMTLADEVSPITDIRSTMAYRRQICGAALSDALHECLRAD